MAVFVIIIVGTVAIFRSSSRDKTNHEPQPKKISGMIATVAPSAPIESDEPINEEVSPNRVYTAEERTEAFAEIRNREYEGSVLDMDTYVSPDPGFSNRWERFKAEQARLPFRYRSENEIAAILDAEPGQMILET